VKFRSDGSIPNNASALPAGSESSHLRRTLPNGAHLQRNDRKYVVVTDRGTQAHAALIRPLTEWAKKNCRMEYIVFSTLRGGWRPVGDIRIAAGGTRLAR
jgi:hypothetical protein